MFSWAKIKRRFVPHFGLFSNLAVKRLPSLFQSNVTKRAGIYLIFSDFPFRDYSMVTFHFPALILNFAMAAQDRFLFPKF